MSASYYIRITLLSVFLILAQVFVFDLIDIEGYGKLMAYPLIIMILPIETPKSVVMLLGFAVGFLIDFLLGTGGLHAAALTAMAYLRGYWISILLSITNNEKKEIETMQQLGLRNFIIYVFLMILTQQTAFYFIERFSFTNFIYTLERVVSGTLVSFLTICLITLLFIPIENKRRTMI